jgi:3-oxoacyl-(acyl-carrier-protein) synthase
MTGFFMSSGVIKVGAAMLCMHEGIIPPICGLEKPEKVLFFAFLISVSLP